MYRRVLNGENHFHSPATLVSGFYLVDLIPTSFTSKKEEKQRTEEKVQNLQQNF